MNRLFSLKLKKINTAVFTNQLTNFKIRIHEPQVNIKKSTVFVLTRESVLCLILTNLLTTMTITLKASLGESIRIYFSFFSHHFCKYYVSLCLLFKNFNINLKSHVYCQIMYSIQIILKFKCDTDEKLLTIGNSRL